MSTPTPARIESAQDVPVIAIFGRLDTNASTAFDAQVEPLLSRKHSRIVLDLGELSYISSAGLRSVLKLIKHTSIGGGRVAAFAVPAQIQEVFTIAGFSALIDVFPDKQSALIGRSV